MKYTGLGSLAAGTPGTGKRAHRSQPAGQPETTAESKPRTPGDREPTDTGPCIVRGHAGSMKPPPHSLTDGSPWRTTGPSGEIQEVNDSQPPSGPAEHRNGDRRTARPTGRTARTSAVSEGTEPTRAQERGENPQEPDLPGRRRAQRRPHGYLSARGESAPEPRSCPRPQVIPSSRPHRTVGGGRRAVRRTSGAPPGTGSNAQTVTDDHSTRHSERTKRARTTTRRHDRTRRPRRPQGTRPPGERRHTSRPRGQQDPASPHEPPPTRKDREPVPCGEKPREEEGPGQQEHGLGRDGVRLQSTRRSGNTKEPRDLEGGTRPSTRRA